MKHWWLAMNIRKDWHSHKLRFLAEVLGTSVTLSASIILALTTPVPPMLLLYCLWNLASLLLLFASYSRGSLGLTLLFAGFLVIDSVGLYRTWLWPASEAL